MKHVSKAKIAAFQKTIMQFYKKNRRSFSWRDDISDYKVFVSEVMLQQTQAGRVEGYFGRFISMYPTFQALAKAKTGDLLQLWKGLGYNRRALNLREAAIIISNQFHGELPHDVDVIDSFPGIGRATACSILVFSKNVPISFIETNIRRVFLHYFFQKSKEGSVADREILPLVEQTMLRKAPRDWFYALMDYGSFLKKEFGNANKKSKMYVKQSKFEGSRREVRGWILKKLLENKGIRSRKVFLDEIMMKFPKRKDEAEDLLKELEKEGFVVEVRGQIKFNENVSKKD